MEWFLAHCSAFFATDMPVFASLLLASLAGSATHCSVMCAPMVTAQMLNLESGGQKQRNILYFHAGRISIYAILGGLAALVANMLFSGQFEQMRTATLLLSGAIFMLSALRPRQTHGCCDHGGAHTRLSPRLALYLRGMAMGLMPCGMVLAALMLVASLTPAQAILGMVIFGAGTVPLLQLAGAVSLRLLRSHPQASKLAARSLMGGSGLLLCAMALH